MKTTFLLLAILVLISCNKEEKNAAGEQTGIVWAEAISSQSPCVIQEGWSEEEWNKENKIDKEKIFNTIKEGVLKGKLQAYNYIDNKPIELEAFKRIISSVDTLMQENPDKPGEMKQVVVKNEVTSDNIARIDTKEKWFFDESKYKLTKKVESLTFFRNSYSETGELRGVYALFNVKLNN